MIRPLVLCAALLSSPALAEDSPAPPAESTAPVVQKLRPFKQRPSSQQHGLAVTLSGALVADVVLELTAELNLPGQHSVAVIGGVGAFQSFGAPVFQFLYVNAGGQYRNALFGDFETAFYLGGEALATVTPGAAGRAAAVTIAPIVGLKYTAPFGLVVDGNLGPGMQIPNFGIVRFDPVFNVQVGWAFGKRWLR